MPLSQIDGLKAEKAIEGLIRVERAAGTSEALVPWDDAVKWAESRCAERGDGLYQEVLRLSESRDVLGTFEKEYVEQLANMLPVARQALEADAKQVTAALLKKPDIGGAIQMLKHGYHTTVLPYSALERIGQDGVLSLVKAAGMAARVQILWDSHRPCTDCVERTFTADCLSIPAAYMPTVLLAKA